MLTMTTQQAFQLAQQHHQAARLAEAEEIYQQILAAEPSHTHALHYLGVIAALTDRPEFGVEMIQKSLALLPGNASFHYNFGYVLAAQGRAEESISAYREALRCQPGQARIHSNLLFALHYAAALDNDAIFAEHRRWEEAHARPLAHCIATHANDPDPARRLRIGYVSPDFREHAVAYFFENLIAGHNREHVEVFCYDDQNEADAVTVRLQQQGAHWRNITNLADEQVSSLIRADRIDILVDLAGHTAGSRLLVFARKPSPVQVSYLGYCDTTGMKVMDFRLTDAHADPPGATEHLHTEQLLRLPDCAWCFRPRDDAPAVGSLPMQCAGHVAFGCFGTLPKLTDVAFDLWSRILLQTPGSHLLLKNAGFRQSSAKMRIRRRLEKAGIAPERVELLDPTTGITEHLAAYDRADIALDTFPYHGTTTTCEALWMGVPVITLAGQVHASRVGVSLLTNVGLPKLIAHDPDEYVRIATDLAKDVSRLSGLRAGLREQMARSPLLDGSQFARNVEEAYRKMWRIWCNKGGEQTKQDHT